MHFLYFLILTTLRLLLFSPLTSATLSPSILRSLDTAPVLHFALSRRGGVFTGNEFLKDCVNLTYLAQELERTESRFNLTTRVVKGNRLVRKAKLDESLRDEGALMGKVADDGLWFELLFEDMFLRTRPADALLLGMPRLELASRLKKLRWILICWHPTSMSGSRLVVKEVDMTNCFLKQVVRHLPQTIWIDLLNFWRLVKSYGRPFPSCTLPTDSFHLPTINASISLPFVYCRPSKFSTDTLKASGSLLGLAPSQHLSQTASKPLLKQLLDEKVIERPIFSLMLINGQAGVLSVGGTGAGAISMVEQLTKDELDRAGRVERGELLAVESAEDIMKKNEMYAQSISDSQKEWQSNWRWSRVQGAEGWWQILLQGVWVDGDKVLKNQGAVIDVMCTQSLSTNPPN